VGNIEIERSAAGDETETLYGGLARSRGTANFSFKRRGPASVLDSVYQSGCLRIRMPRPENPASPDAIVINTSGGLTGGDKISLAAHWQSGTSAALCSQAAEKIYRSSGGHAAVSNRLDVQEGASAEWLPQETIIFNQAQLNRKCEVSVAHGGRFLGLESIVFGRAAMGEEVTSGQVRDGWRIFRASRLIYADVFHIDGTISARLDRSAIGACARAFGTILLIAGENLVALVEQLRAAFVAARGRAAATQWNGVLAARFLARDGEILRHDMVLALNILRSGRPLPRPWQC
jgi:urease accessory protein